MSSSKIQSYNLDPDMDLAKESSVQEVLEKLDDVNENVNNSGVQVGGISVQQNVYKSKMKRDITLWQSERLLSTAQSNFSMNNDYFFICDTSTHNEKGTMNCVVQKYSKANFELVGEYVLFDESYFSNVHIASNNNYFFIVHYVNSSSSIIEKYDVNSMTFIDSVEVYGCYGMYADPYNEDYLFFIDVGKTISKLTISTMSITFSNITPYSTTCWSFDENYIYACKASSTASSRHLVKIQKSDMSVATTNTAVYGNVAPIIYGDYIILNYKIVNKDTLAFIAGDLDMVDFTTDSNYHTENNGVVAILDASTASNYGVALPSITKFDIFQSFGTILDYDGTYYYVSEDNTIKVKKVMDYTYQTDVYY